MLKQGIIYITSLVKCCNDSYFVTMGTNLKPCDWYRRTRFRMRWLAIGGEHGSVCDGSLSYGTLHLTSSFKVLLDQGVTKKGESVVRKPQFPSICWKIDATWQVRRRGVVMEDVTTVWQFVFPGIRVN